MPGWGIKHQAYPHSLGGGDPKIQGGHNWGGKGGAGTGRSTPGTEAEEVQATC